MKIATWNINSIRVRLQQLSDWLQKEKIDILALQETKCVDEKFPAEALQELGYCPLYAGQKSYNGVAILAKKPLVAYPLPENLNLADHQRILIAPYQDYLIVNIYVPNGQSVGSDKYEFKLKWLANLIHFIENLKKSFPKIIILGDFNIAPTPQDYAREIVADEAGIMLSPLEKKFFNRLLELQFYDSFRLFCKEDHQYTWWDYRLNAFKRNLGYRIDHILVSHSLIDACKDCVIDRSLRGLTQPSDHAPVILSLHDAKYDS